MLVETLKIAAGRYNFTPGQQIDLPTKEAQELIAEGAVVAVGKDGELDFSQPKKKQTAAPDEKE